MDSIVFDIRKRLQQHLEVIYRGVDSVNDYLALSEQLLDAMALSSEASEFDTSQNHWDQNDVVLITYGDSFIGDEEYPLDTLMNFLDGYCDEIVTGVHILPFFEFSSDDGFAVINYVAVNQALGGWEHIAQISSKYDLMSDLVINHCSSRSVWFDNFKQGKHPGADYFFTASPDDNLEMVVRPRTNELLKAVETPQGAEHVWCTFGHDQIDFDFRNPQVLLEFVQIIRHYLNHGVRIFRLDAVAFLWKEIGTSCLNLEQTHELVRLLRTLISCARSDAVIITETNIPNRENLSYFGDANEAHCIYNFSLPPLLLNTLVTGNATYLQDWQKSMPPAREGTCYFNFIASHDGIGLRPAEGLLDNDELEALTKIMRDFGGRISWRDDSNGNAKPYEINISLFDALQGTLDGKDDMGIQRFVCAHTILFGLEGIPGLYVHSLLATGNDYERVENAGHNRAINRHQWDWEKLVEQLAQPESQHATVYSELSSLLSIRKQQPAFHPNATQFTLNLGSQIFAFWRQSIDRSQSIFCISNISNEEVRLSLSDINLICTDEWFELISQSDFSDLNQTLMLSPYRTLWVTNRLYH